MNSEGEIRSRVEIDAEQPPNIGIRARLNCFRRGINISVRCVRMPPYREVVADVTKYDAGWVAAKGAVCMNQETRTKL